MTSEPGGAAGPRGTVPVLDLRTADLAALVGRDFSHTLAELSGASPRDEAGRMILVDDAAGLVDHDDVFEFIFSSGLEVSVLCVVVGADASGPTLRRPAHLRPPQSATVWTGDIDGVHWRMGSHRADSAAPAADRVQPLRPRTPDTLLEALRLPPVFDAVLNQVGLLPDAAASPGLLVLASDGGAPEADRALAAALRMLTARPERSAEGHGRYDEVEALLDRAEAGTAGPTTEPAGRGQAPSGTSRHRRDLVLRAKSDLARLTRPGALLAGRVPAVAPSLDAAATELGAAAARAQQAIRRFGTAGPSETPRPAGTGRPVAVASETVFDAVDRAVAADFAARRPMPIIARRLRWNAERVRARATSAQRDRLLRLRPEDWERRIRETAPLAGRPSAAQTFGTAAVCVVAASPPHSGAVGAAAVAVAAAVASLWLRIRFSALVPDRPSGRTGTLWQLAASATGAAVGEALSTLLWPGTPTASGSLLSAVLGLVAAGALAVWWWHASVTDWTQRLRLDVWARAADEAEEVARYEMRDGAAVTAARSAVADYERILAGVVDDTAAMLLARGTPSGGGSGTADSSELHGATTDPWTDPWAEPLRSAAGVVDGTSPTMSPRVPRTATGQRHEVARALGDPGVVRALITSDLCDIGAAVLDRFREGARRPGAALPGPDAVGAEAEELFEEYRRHLQTAGVHHQPPICRDPRARRADVDGMWSGTRVLPDLIWCDARDERFVQLCTAPQLALLDSDPSGARMVRFAPYAARHALADAPAQEAAESMVWTGTSRVFGVLRLVGLRRGSVEDLWSMTAPPASAAEADGTAWEPSSPAAVGSDTAADDERRRGPAREGWLDG